MKKLTAYLVLSLLALPVFAQQPQHSETPSPILHSTVFTAQDGLLSINLMDHVFVGYNIVDADAFTPNGGGELSLNALALNVSPAPSFGFQVGMDCKWQFFSTHDSRFYLDKNKIPQVIHYPIPTPENTAQAQSSSALPEDLSHITYIGEEALMHTSIAGILTIPEGLETLGRRAFYDNDKLTEVVWAHTPATMGVEIFSSCNKIERVTFADALDIPALMFNGCDLLSDIVFDASVTSIGEGAFGSCKALKSLTLPPSVTYLANSAFAYCTALETIILSDNITYIGEGAFSNCSALEEIVLPAKLETM